MTFIHRITCREVKLTICKINLFLGGNAGIGKVTALELARRGARVIMLCRDMKKAETVAQEIR